MRTRIPPQSAAAVRLDSGDRLVVVNPEGEQVSDLTCFPADDLSDGLSSGRTMEGNGSMRLRTGSGLWSRKSRLLMTIQEDTCGVHDILLGPCTPEMFSMSRGETDHANCLDNLDSVLAPLSVERRDIVATLNIFMNLAVQPDGDLVRLPSVARPGSHTSFRAEVPLIAGITACAAEVSNNRTFKPIDVEVVPAA